MSFYSTIRTCIALAALLLVSFTCAYAAPESAYWLMDWREYGPVDDGARLELREAFRIEKDEPVVSPKAGNRIYWEKIEPSVKPLSIAAGADFWIVTSAEALPFTFSYFGKSCETSRESFPGSWTLWRVECPQTMLPKYFFGDSASLQESEKLVFGSQRGGLLDPNYLFKNRLPYQSYAAQYWRRRGINVFGTEKRKNEESAYSAECAMIADKLRYAVGYFLARSPRENKPELLASALQSVKEAEQERDGDKCHDLGRDLKCYFGEKGCGAGWGRIWSVNAEFSVRQIMYSKWRLIEKEPGWNEIKKSITSPQLKVPVFQAPQKVWGGGSPGQMNKFGRIWQFLANPVIASRK